MPTREQLEQSRSALLESVRGVECVHFCRPPGNIGDRLIHAGIRQVLKPVKYQEFDLLGDLPGGEFAMVSGGGGWCGSFHGMPGYVERVEKLYERVVVWPTSFEVANATVAARLPLTRARLFAREPVSYEAIKSLPGAALALDTAFFFDYEAYRWEGSGVLKAFRVDKAKRIKGLPANNNDISKTATDLDQWLHTIAAHEEVWTDRTHVMIAAALLGKRVRFCEESYAKLVPMAAMALGEFDVREIEFEFAGA